MGKYARAIIRDFDRKNPVLGVITSVLACLLFVGITALCVWIYRLPLSFVP